MTVPILAPARRIQLDEVDLAPRDRRGYHHVHSASSKRLVEGAPRRPAGSDFERTGRTGERQLVLWPFQYSAAARRRFRSPAVSHQLPSAGAAKNFAANAFTSAVTANTSASRVVEGLQDVMPR